MFTYLLKFTCKMLIITSIVGGAAFLLYKNVPDLFSILSQKTSLVTHPNSDMIIGAVKELNTLEVFTAPMTQTFDVDMDRGKMFFFFDNKVHQKYLVTAEVVFTVDFSALTTGSLNWDTKTVNIVLPTVTAKNVILKTELVANSNSGLNQNVAMTVDEQNAINKDVTNQVNAVLNTLAGNYTDKATAARDHAVSAILSKFGLTLNSLTK